MKSDYTPGQTVYEVAINILTSECVIEPQIILYAGNELLLVEGKSAEWGQTQGEQTLHYSCKDKWSKAEVMKSSTVTTWTDNLFQAEIYKSEITFLLESKRILTN